MINPYSEVDPVIDKWVELLGSKLFVEWAGQPNRWFHIHGDPPFECFQIAIARPEGEQITVYARAIDTNDGAEDDMDTSWSGRAVELDQMLAIAVNTINGWKERPRKKPDPPPPRW